MPSPIKYILIKQACRPRILSRLGVAEYAHIIITCTSNFQTYVLVNDPQSTNKRLFYVVHCLCMNLNGKKQAISNPA